MWGVIDNFSKCPQKKWQKKTEEWTNLYIFRYIFTQLYDNGCSPRYGAWDNKNGHRMK